MSRNLYLENLGCAKNQVDAEVMGTLLERQGWQWIDHPDAAELIVVNTCGFIEPAQEESIDRIMQLIAAHPNTPVIAAGCLSQRFPQQLAEGIPELAAVFGNRAPERIGELLERIATETSENPLVWTPDGTADLPSLPRKRLISHPGSAFIKVAEGCDHRCTFCAIPLIRGRVRTRPLEAIVAEAAELAQRGILEFNLIAQDLAAFDRPNLAELLAQLAAAVGKVGGGASAPRWIRSLYLYPDRFPLEIVPQTSIEGPLLPYFDISFQHGSTGVLRRMGRPGNAESYLALVAAIRDANPDVVLRSSIIVGFPGETEEDVAALELFLRTARLEWVGFFAYSTEEGTPAARLAAAGAAVPVRVVKERLARLKAVQEEIAATQLQRFVGRTIPVLIEEAVQGTSLYLGRGPMHAGEVDGLVVLDASNTVPSPGTIVRAQIRALNGLDFAANIVK